MKRKSNYGHQELAMLYFPHVLPQSASKQLSRRIMRDKDLSTALEKAGYSKKQRSYTPLQTDILFDHMGDPDTWDVQRKLRRRT